MTWRHGTTADGCTWMLSASPLEDGRVRLTGRLGLERVDCAVSPTKAQGLSACSALRSCTELSKWLRDDSVD